MVYRSGREDIAEHRDVRSKKNGCIRPKLGPMAAGRVRHAIINDLQLSGQVWFLGQQWARTGRPKHDDGRACCGNVL